MDFLVILGLIAVVTAILPWINASRISSLREEILQLRQDIRLLQDRQTAKPQKSHIYTDTADALYRAKENRGEYEAPSSVEEEYRNSEIFPYQTEENYPSTTDISGSSDIAANDDISPSPTVETKGAEFNLGAKLPVWVGAISLIFAAFFLVRYSLESGLLGPIARISIAAVAGVGMTIAGHLLIKRPQIANFERIAQGLTGAGIVTLYGCLYAAVNIYQMIPSGLGFAGMSVVTCVALVASMRMGQPIALFALIGGFSTPALMNSSEPNNLLLCSYLFILFTGFSLILMRRGWWSLWILSLFGVFSWTAIWFLFSFNPEEAFPMLVMQVAIVGVVISSLHKFILSGYQELSGDQEQARSLSHKMILSAVIGVALTVLAFSTKMTMGLFDWSVLGLMGAAAIFLSYFQPSTYRYGLVAILALHLLSYVLWVEQAAIQDKYIVLAGTLLLYAVIPQIFIRRGYNLPLWSGVQLATIGSLYAICYLFLHVDGNTLATIGLLIAALCIAQIIEFQKNRLINEEIRNVVVSMYAFAASAFISVGMAILLPGKYLSLALGLQVMGTLWVCCKTRLYVLDSIAVILTTIFVLLNYEQIYLFLNLIASSMIDSKPQQHIDQYVLENPLLVLGLPAIALIAGGYMRIRADFVNRKMIHLILGTGGVTALALSYYAFRGLYQNNMSFAFEPGFLERACVSFMIAFWAFVFSRYGRDGIEKTGAVLFHVFLARIVWFDLIMDNPYFDATQKVGNLPLINGIGLVYLGSMGIIFYALQKEILVLTSTIQKFYHLIIFTLFMIFVSLTVRHFYHGQLLHLREGTPPMELYTYSVVWLLSGLGLLTLGITKNNHLIRITSFAVIGLTVVKVFLIDAANLEGLYRVFSFFGLGVSLIALSYFYSKSLSYNLKDNNKR